VTRRFERRGAVIIDSDALAREVVAPGTGGLAEIVAEFGQGVLDDAGALDRAAMAKRVFGDEQARARLGAIVHPRVAERSAELRAAAPPDAIVVHDVPLLVEAGYVPQYHLVVIVDAPVEDRVRRLLARGMEEPDARARMRVQATTEQRREAADAWLDNSGSEQDLNAAVDRLWDERLVPFESNVRSRRPAGRGGPRIVDPDGEWPREARRAIERIRTAAGSWALRVDHIGSTSVPGLAAKDVLDLQVSVRSVTDADGLTDALADIGFPVWPGLDHDTPRLGISDPAQWIKRVHAAADPGRPVNVHVRAMGAANWRYALLFPAWLRADDHARAEYEALKRELADRFASEPDSQCYTDRKDEWIGRALATAEEWARRTGWTPPS
jgi:dephospho-CoA kinase